MAKPSAQVQLIHARSEIKRLNFELQHARLVSTKFCADAAVIAAHRVFQRKGEIIAEFQEQYQRLCQEIAELVVEDSTTKTKDGSYLEYSKHTIDEAYREALTDAFFVPWDERHSV